MDKILAPHTRVRRLWFLGLFFLLAVALTAAIWHGCQSQWRTYTLRSSAGTDLTLRIAYLPGWKPLEIDEETVVDFIRQPPQGATRWWYQHILRQGIGQWEEEKITVGMLSRLQMGGQDIQNIDMLEQQIRRGYRHSPYEHASLHRFAHPLGPALEVTSVYASFLPPASPRRLRIASIFIFPKDTPAHQHRYLFVHAIAAPAPLSHLRPTLMQMAHRLRFADTN